MYEVFYYMTGGNLTSKIFENLHDATMFIVKEVGREQCYEVVKVKNGSKI